MKLTLALVVLAFGAAAATAQQPVGTVEVELRGPLDEVRFRAGRGETRINTPLAAGESRRLVVPIEVRETQGLSRALTDAEPECARPLGELSEPRAWGTLPRGLQSRSLPALERVRPGPGMARLAWLIAAALLVLALRRRPARCAGVGLIAAVGVFLLPAPIARTSLIVVQEGLTVMPEGQASSGRWLEVRGARDRLDIAPEAVFWTRLLPSTDDGYLEVLDVAGRVHWRVCAPGSRVFTFQELSAAPVLSRQRNGHADFERTWIREAGAGWAQHGPWAVGEALPRASEPGAGNLPGWLAAALPQGVGVFIGVSHHAGETRWVRLVGF